MSEETRNTTNTVVIVLIVAVVALAAVLVYSFWKNSNAVPSVGDLPANSAAGTGAAGTDTGTDPAAAGGGTGAPAAGGAASGEFDAKTATKVPAGTTPLDFVKAYHEDIMQGKYEEAYKMLPLDKQQSYGDAAAYAEQVKAYGITSYELGAPNETGDTWSVAATQVTPQMPITYTWTLKKVGDQWYVARTMGGS